MEWILLAADDFDDLLGSVRHKLFGIRQGLATWLVIISSVISLVAVSTLGVTPVLFAGLGLFVSVAIAFAWRRRVMALDPPDFSRSLR